MIRRSAEKIKQAAFRSNANYFKKVSSEGLIFALILSCTFIFLTASIVRVINNARNNYEIFNLEKNSLEELEEKNQNLQDELQYVSSDEYKRLFLRDTEGLSAENEELFSRREEASVINNEQELLPLKEKIDYSDWWAGLLVW